MTLCQHLDQEYIPYSINFQGVNISLMSQILHFHNFMFKDYLPNVIDDYEFQGLNFSGIYFIRENIKIYIQQRFTHIFT